MISAEEEKIINVCMANREQLSLEREEIEDELMAGIPLIRGSQLLLIQCIYDFELNGFKVVLNDHITYVRRGDIEKYHDEIFKMEKIESNRKIIENISVNNWKDFFADIMNQEKMIDISLEWVDDEKTFFVGKIKSVFDDRISILEISPLGKWKDMPITICFDKITTVGFGDRYNEMLEKYKKE